MQPPAILIPADVIAYVLVDLAIILIAARLVGAVFVRFSQPRVVGEIIAGILIGPTILGGKLATPATPSKPAVDGQGLVNDLYPLQAASVLNAIGQVALVLFMFLVAVELDQSLLRGRGRQIVTVAVAVVAVPVAAGFAVGALLDGAQWRPDGIGYVPFSLFVGAALSVTAFPVMARILQEKGLMDTRIGAVGIGAAAIVTVMMFLVIAAASAAADGSGVADAVAVKAGLTVALVVGLMTVGRWLLAVLTRRFDTPAAVDGVIGAVLPLVLLGAVAADRIGISALVGGFLVGLALPRHEGLATAITARLQTLVVVVLLPVFLAVSGLRTNLRLLEWAMLGGIALFLAAMVLTKWGSGYAAGRAAGLSSNDAHLLGVLMNCRGLLILVVGLIGLQLGVITPALQVVFVLGAILTTLMTGPLADRFTSRSPEDATAPTA